MFEQFIFLAHVDIISERIYSLALHFYCFLLGFFPTI